MKFGSEEKIVNSFLLWSHRFKEHCLVLTFYLHNLNELEYKSSPLDQEANQFREKAFELLRNWDHMCRNFEDFRSTRQILSDFVGNKNLKDMEINLINLLTLKKNILSWREKHKFPGPISMALLKHMIMEAEYVYDLLTGKMTIEKEIEIAAKEAKEHTQFIAQQIELVNEEGFKEMENLIHFAQVFFIGSNVQTKSFLEQALQKIDKILPKKIPVNMPDAFLHHENLETQYFIERLELIQK